MIACCLVVAGLTWLLHEADDNVSLHKTDDLESYIMQRGIEEVRKELNEIEDHVD